MLLLLLKLSVSKNLLLHAVTLGVAHAAAAPESGPAPAADAILLLLGSLSPHKKPPTLHVMAVK